MSVSTLSSSIVVGNLAADVEVKTVDVGGGAAHVAEATIYVRYTRRRDESFRVSLSIWEDSPGWRVLEYLKKGSLIAAYGAMEPSPYITSTSNEPRAGLHINPVNRIELISVKGDDSQSQSSENLAETAAG